MQKYNIKDWIRFANKDDGKRINKDDKKYNNSNLIYNSNHCFYKYHNIEKFDNFSFKSKYSFLVDILNDLDNLVGLKTQKEDTKDD